LSTNNANNIELKTSNTKAVWGSGGGAAASGAPVDNTAMYNTGNINNKKVLFPDAPKNPYKAEPKPADIKKEALKNSLFSGIQDKKKDSDDSDEDEKPKAIEPAPVEMNLLDFD
jgi:hypothetical protein